MQSDVYAWFVVAATFVSVSLVVVALGFSLDRRRQISMRLQEDASATGQPLDRAIGSLALNMTERLDAVFAGRGVMSSSSKVRMELVQAGFFSPQAPMIYAAAKIVLPLVAIAFSYLGMKAFSPSGESGAMLAVMASMAFAGYKGPEAFVSRKKDSLAAVYRATFPDFLDLLLVCIDAGLSMNAAVDRVAKEFDASCKPFAINLSLMLSEVRSGRAFPDALENLSVRLGIDEAKSFVTLVKQSLELGSDVSTALRVYSDEMRVKRLLRAELMANALPIKMLLPLGVFIFPALLIVVLTPAMMSLSAIFSSLVRK
ncbi:type II secretion system F family protein [Methylocystis sp. JAN1]|uniref:type II secretion system F family protein n=1 Tax=Methylocystis sp. JAN1 TaxID=3397211 RepID=UPI003FA2F033